MTVWNARAFLILLICVFTGCSAPDSGTAGSDSGGKSAYGSKQLARCEASFEEMKAVLKLDAAAESELANVHEAHTKKMKDWFDESGVELVALRKEALDAAREKDLAKLREMEADGKKKRVTELTEEERVLVADHLELLLDSVEPAQATSYKAHVITKQLIEFLDPIELTGEQVAEVNKLAEKVISRIAPNQVWRSEGTISLEKEVLSQVLSAEQRSQYDEFDRSKGLQRLQWSN